MMENQIMERMFEEALTLREMLAPHRGQWVAMDFHWTRVVAAHGCRPGCIAMARMAEPDTLHVIYKVPEREKKK